MNNVFSDTCVYRQPGVDLLADVIANKKILLGSETIGVIGGIDPQPGSSSTIRNAIPILS